MKQEVFDWMVAWLCWTYKMFFSRSYPRTALDTAQEEIQQIREEYVHLVRLHAPHLSVSWPNFESVAFLPRQIKFLGTVR
jgi:hypothetical protein